MKVNDVSETWRIYFEKYCIPKTLTSYQEEKNSFLCDKRPNVKHKDCHLKKYKKLNYTYVVPETIFSSPKLPDFQK